MDYLQSLNSGEVSLALIVGYGLVFKILLPFMKIMSQQNDNQRLIVHNAGADATRNDDILKRVLDILTSNLTKLTDTGVRQTEIMHEIKTITKDTNIIVAPLPLTLEQRFNSLEKQIALYDKHNLRTQKMVYWMMQKLNLPVEEVVKK